MKLLLQAGRPGLLAPSHRQTRNALRFSFALLVILLLSRPLLQAGRPKEKEHDSADARKKSLATEFYCKGRILLRGSTLVAGPIREIPPGPGRLLSLVTGASGLDWSHSEMVFRRLPAKPLSAPSPDHNGRFSLGFSGILLFSSTFSSAYCSELMIPYLNTFQTLCKALFSPSEHSLSARFPPSSSPLMYAHTSSRSSPRATASSPYRLSSARWKYLASTAVTFLPA